MLTSNSHALSNFFGGNMFDNWMDFSFPEIGRTLYGAHAENVMRTDVREKDQTYEIDIDLPGFKKEEVGVKLENGYLTVEAQRNIENDDKQKDGKYIRRERYAGSMSRSFYVGSQAKQSDIHANFKDGILTLSVPKYEQSKVEENKYIPIEG